MPKGASSNSGKSAAPKNQQEEAPSQTTKEILESQERKRVASTRTSSNRAPLKEWVPATSTPDTAKDLDLESLRMHSARYNPNTWGTPKNLPEYTPTPKFVTNMITSTDSKNESHVFTTKHINETVRSKLSDTIPINESEIDSAEPHSSHQVPKKIKEKEKKRKARHTSDSDSNDEREERKRRKKWEETTQHLYEQILKNMGQPNLWPAPNPAPAPWPVPQMPPAPIPVSHPLPPPPPGPPSDSDNDTSQMPLPPPLVPAANAPPLPAGQFLRLHNHLSEVVAKKIINESYVELSSLAPNTGRERLIRSHSLARFCFELSRNLN